MAQGPETTPLSKKASLPLSELTAITPLDGRYREKVDDIAPYTSEYALIKTRVEIEARYLVALSEIGMVRPLKAEEKETLLQMGPTLTLSQAERVKEIESTTRHDVKAMERAFREFVSGTSLEDVTEMIHFGLTSEDVNNLSYRLMLDRAKNDVMVPAMDKVIDWFLENADKYKALPLLARTHGQPAVPTTLGKELANIAVRLNKQTRKLEEYKLTGKLNGAVGNDNAKKLAAADVDWIEFSKKFVESLGLESNPFTTQINPYEDVIELLQIYQRLNGVVVDTDQDMWRYISDNWFTQEVKKGEVGSSTMPQKVNPIDFENSEGNAGAANAWIDFFTRKLAVSRLQRDLSDSTVMRNIGADLGYGLLAYRSLLSGLRRIHPNEEFIRSELNEDYSILTEGVQTVLRKEGEKDPYSLIAGLARGKKIGPDEWKDWVNGLPIDIKIKEKLAGLTPETYLGEAVKLTDLAIKEIQSSRNK